MKRRNCVLLASCLTVGLAGCHNLTGISNLPLSPGASSQAKGKVSLTIKWPEYRTNALPGSTQAVVLTVKKDGVQDGAQTITRDGIKSGDASTSHVSLDLGAGTGYTLEAKAYNSASDLSEANVVATGTSAPFEIRSGYSTQVKMTLLVPNGPRFDASGNPLGGGQGCEATFRGAHFGSDKAKVQVFYTMSENWGQDKLDVLELSDTSLKLKMPSNAFGPIKLKVLVDGVSSNVFDFQMINDLELSYVLKEDYSVPGQPMNYLVKGAPLDLKVKGRIYNPSQNTLNSVIYTVKVKDADGNDVTNQNTGADGKIAINASGTYTIEVKSGSLTKEVLCKTVDLEWSPTPPSAFTTAPYYIPGVDGCDPSKGVSLTGYYLEDGGRQIKLMKSDFEWIFQPTGFAFLEGSYDQKIRFKGGAKTGTTQIGATLKCDPRQTFSFNVSNVKIEALNLKYSLDTYQWATPATAVAGSIDLPLGSGKVAVIKVDSVSITGGQEKSVGNDWAFNNNLSWTSGTAGIVSTEIRSDKTVVVTPLALGTTTLQVVDSDEPNKAKVVTINVVNQQ